MTWLNTGWLVSKGKLDQARKVMNWKFKHVQGYDIERELGIIAATIEKQRVWERQANAGGPFAIFKGLNLKRFLIASWPKVLQQVGVACNLALKVQVCGDKCLSKLPDIFLPDCRVQQPFPNHRDLAMRRPTRRHARLCPG